jgi:hypothetical protein
MLSKKSSKKEVLDMYASGIQKERVKLANIKKKRRARAQASAQSSDSDSSDSDVSVNVIESDNGKKGSDVDLPNGTNGPKQRPKSRAHNLSRPSEKLARHSDIDEELNASEDSTWRSPVGVTTTSEGAFLWGME